MKSKVITPAVVEPLDPTALAMMVLLDSHRAGGRAGGEPPPTGACVGAALPSLSAPTQRRLGASGSGPLFIGQMQYSVRHFTWAQAVNT